MTEPDLEALIRMIPLSNSAERARVESGDLDYAEEVYAREATFNAGSEHWWVWQAVQARKGRSLEEQVESLSPEARRWLARWAFSKRQVDLAMVAYRRYLEEPYIVTLPRETLEYLSHFFDQGRFDEVIRIVDSLERRFGDASEERFMAARARLRLGQGREAVTEMRRVAERYREAPETWAHLALIEAEAGDLASARSRVETCARLGLDDPGLVSQLLEATGAGRGTWEELRSRWPRPGFDFIRDTTRHLQSPGAWLRPSAGPTRHHFGGTDFDLPECWGCGRPIRQWFCLDLREVPEVHARLPEWELFPLLGCADCMVWMGRHDYQLHGSSLELVNVAISCKEFGEAYEPAPELPRQYASLEWREPIENPSESDLEARREERPQVGGTPEWTQEELRPSCRSCGAEMVFVAAMTSAPEFEPYVPINNESGFQYHFACGSCRTLSVIAQWT